MAGKRKKRRNRARGLTAPQRASARGKSGRKGQRATRPGAAGASPHPQTGDLALPQAAAHGVRTDADRGHIDARPDAVRADLPPILRIWQHRDYALFQCGQIPSNTTAWIQRVGASWLAWDLTHSYTWLGLVAAADLAPILLLGPIAGAFTDRTNPMPVLRASQALLTLQAIVLAAVMWSGQMTIEILFGLSIVSGLIQPFGSAARQTIVPSVVPRGEFATALALDSALFHATRFVGPAIAAALIIPTYGVAGTFTAQIFGCLVILVTLFFMHVPPPDRRHMRSLNLVRDVGEGLRYVSGHAGIAPLFVLLIVFSLLLRPVQDMLPGFADRVFHTDAQGLAWLTSSMGVGAMLSATSIAMRGRTAGLTMSAIVGGCGLFVATIGLAATSSLWLGVLFCALSGFCLNTLSTSVQTLTQAAVADDMRGRVMSLYILIFRGMPAIGGVTLGHVAEWFGLPATFAVASVVCFATCLAIAPRRQRIAAVLEHGR